MKKNDSMAEAFVVMAAGAVIFAASFGIEQITTSKIGPDFMPRVVAVIIFLLGAGMLFEAVRQKKEEVKTVPIKPEKDRLTAKQWILKELHWINWIWMFAYACSMKKVGFLFSTIVYFFVAMILLTMKDEKRNWPCIAVLALVMPTAIYIVFRQKFFLMLPVGWCEYLPFNILK